MCILINLMIINKWKISSHMIGIGGITGLIFALSFRLQVLPIIYMISVFLISGLVGYSRLKLNAHNPAQLYSGYLMSFFITFMIVLFL